LLGTQFYAPAAGVVEPSQGEADTDYHAMLAVGYGHDNAQRFILVRNSWGDAWGIAGCAWLAAEYLKARLYAFARMEKAL
jgi:C1A family cysteine protease